MDARKAAATGNHLLPGEVAGGTGSAGPSDARHAGVIAVHRRPIRKVI